MESYAVKNLTFSYPEQDRKVLDDITMTIKQGEFVVLCGSSGCGKTTLLRQLKTVLSPHGRKTGSISFEGQPLDQLDQREQSSRIGFVLQSPENQIVTDKVWHELAFGLESLAYDTPTIRLRVAEMASFFGIQNWFYKNVTDLSGGQKQILNLAAIMAMQPSVLILDEPTSQLDPIAASDFLTTVSKINRELGTTIILTEHRLDDAMPMADRAIVMDAGKIIADGKPKEVGQSLSTKDHKMFLAMPTPMRVYAGVDNDLQCPITVREGREWLSNFAKTKAVSFQPDKVKEDAQLDRQATVEIKDAWFKYDKESPDILKGLALKAYKGELLAVLGGNGTGKTTMLSLISGINKPYRGQVMLEALLGVMPQDPQSLFVKKTVELDLYEMLKTSKTPKNEQERRVRRVARLCGLTKLMGRHPYDLSGGEQQRTALAKILLLDPEILLLDEPTKGMDAEFKQTFAGILNRLLEQGVTIIMVSHDIEFCAKYAHRCSLFFDGGIVAEGTPQDFFTGNSFYTTAANRMSRHMIPQVVTAEDAIRACGGTVLAELDEDFFEKEDLEDEARADIAYKEEKKIKSNIKPGVMKLTEGEGNLSKRTIVASILILLIIPLTIFAGIFYFGDRKYYFISILLILEMSLPFIMIFEGRKPQARELVVIAVLCAITVAGRGAFFMIPQFKPVAALVIISGVALGGESGFLVGAMSMFLSNMMFGQGPLTPWQMFAMGIIGFLSGVLFQKGLLRRNRISLAIFGGIAVFFIYGGIMNPASILTFQANITWPMIITSLITGLPFDLVHAGATVFFILIIGEPMLEKLDRIKVKYGLVQG